MGSTSPEAGRRRRDGSVSSWPHEEPVPAPAAPRRSPRKAARPARASPFPIESDPAVLSRREKQIEYGKNTLAYQEYARAVPRAQRLGYHPRTPVKRRQQSRRRWDNAIRCWRVHLHYWNDPAKLAELRGRDSGSDASSVVSDPVDSVAAAAAARPDPGGEPQDEWFDWAEDVEALALEMDD